MQVGDLVRYCGPPGHNRQGYTGIVLKFGRYLPENSQESLAIVEVLWAGDPIPSWITRQRISSLPANL